MRGTAPPSPPGRQGDFNEMRREIIRLEGEIKTNSERGIVQLNIKTEKYVGTVPPNNHTKIGLGGVHVSTRKCRTKNVKGVEPKGPNKEIWNLKRSMNKMFETGKLERGTVPPTPERAPLTVETVSTSTATRMPVPIINIPPKNGTGLERADLLSETVPPNPEREPKSGTFPPSTATGSKLSRKFPPGERSVCLVPSRAIPPRDSEQSVKRGTVPADICQTGSILQMRKSKSHWSEEMNESAKSNSVGHQLQDKLETLNFASKNSRKVKKNESSPKIMASSAKVMKQFWENTGNKDLKSTSRPKLCLTNKGVAVPPRNCVGQLP